MSRRWFILAFSLVFLFLFRTWINELSTTERYRVGIVDSGNNNQLMIYPASSSSIPELINGENNVLSTLRKSSESQYIELLENNNELLYIFPIFPDTLAYTMHEVIVNYETRVSSANRAFRFSDY